MSEYHECHGCGMMVASGAYHPYAACLMFRACLDGEVVRANLDGVMAHGIQYHSEEIPLRERIASLEAENAALQRENEALTQRNEELEKLLPVFRPLIALAEQDAEARFDKSDDGADYERMVELKEILAKYDAALSQPSDQQGGEG